MMPLHKVGPGFSTLDRAFRAFACALAATATACEPTVGLGDRLCLQQPGDGAVTDPDASVGPVFSTGFEDGFCEYAPPMGFCFSTGISSYSLVRSPVHSGQYAAEFNVNALSDGGSQTRCVQQGVFPGAAYYGAWYYVAAAAKNTGNWNLLHFQGGVPGQTLHNLWDVSLVSLSDGGLRASLADYVSQAVPPDAGTVPLVPVEQWFHLEVFFRRAKDTTGEISLSQDGMTVANLTGVETDDTDWGQWYVGNLATALTPPASTVYVDDVTIGLMPSASQSTGP